MKPIVPTGLKSLGIKIDNYIQNINNSKIFAGFMIITLNIASKFINFKLSKSVERYLKHTFSKQILVFVIAWMGTRDIYMALLITVIFIICVDYIFNEDSAFCCLPTSMTDSLAKLDEDETVSEEDAKKAEAVVDKYEKQKKSDEGNELLTF
jgi:hypothetical protein